MIEDAFVKLAKTSDRRQRERRQAARARKKQQSSARQAAARKELRVRRPPYEPGLLRRAWNLYDDTVRPFVQDALRGAIKSRVVPGMPSLEEAGLGHVDLGPTRDYWRDRVKKRGLDFLELAGKALRRGR